jgi:hypothetical protein
LTARDIKIKEWKERQEAMLTGDSVVTEDHDAAADENIYAVENEVLNVVHSNVSSFL